MQRGPELFSNGLLLHLDAGRQPDPQVDPKRNIQVVGPWPVPLDGFATWDSLDRPVNLAWDLRPAEEIIDAGLPSFQPDQTGSYRGVPRSVAASSFVRPVVGGDGQGQLLPGPQMLQPPLPLPGALTIAMWVWLPPTPEGEPTHSEAAVPQLPAAPLIQLGNGSAVALHGNGIGISGCIDDPMQRLVNFSVSGALPPQNTPPSERVAVPRSRWMLLFLVSPGAGQACSVLGAWDAVGIRSLGSLGSLPSNAQLESLGGQEPIGAGFLSQVAVWSSALDVQSQRAIFAADAVRFGCISDSQVEAVRAGLLPSRTPVQEAEFLRRLELARNGGDPGGVANFAQFSFLGGLWARDDDVPVIVESLAEGEIEAPNLSGAMLTADGIRVLMAELRKNPYQVKRVDLSGCEAIRDMSSILAAEFPFEKGLSLEVQGCGLTEAEVAQFRNRTVQADEMINDAILRKAEVDARVAKYRSLQWTLEESAAEDRDSLAPTATPAPLHAPKKWPKGNDRQARLAYKAFKERNPEGLVQADLEDGGFVWNYTDGSGQSKSIANDEFEALCKDAERQIVRAGLKWFSEEEVDPEEGAAPQDNWLKDEFGDRKNYVGFMLWNGAKPAEPELEAGKRRGLEWEQVWAKRQGQRRELSELSSQVYDPARLACQIPKENVASGQLVAHLTFLQRDGNLDGGCMPERHDTFGLKWISEFPKSAPSRGSDIHEAIDSGKVRLASVVGKCFGKDALEVVVQNLTAAELEIRIPCGSIFQHCRWEQRANVITAVDYLFKIPAGGSTSKRMAAHSMNLRCPAPQESPMNLTEFYIDNLAVLENQGTVWDFFEATTTKPLYPKPPSVPADEAEAQGDA